MKEKEEDEENNQKICREQANKQTNRQAENSKPEATLIPCGSWGGAGQFYHNI